MKRLLFLIGIALVPAAAARGQAEPPADAVQKLRKQASRLVMRGQKAGGVDRLALAELCDRALDLAIDLKPAPDGFEAYALVVEHVGALEEEKGAALLVEAMDGLIESYLDDDRLVTVVTGPLAALPEPLADRAKEYVDWIERDSQSLSVQCWFRFERVAKRAARAIDPRECQALTAELKTLQRDCGHRYGPWGQKWSAMLDEELAGLALVGQPVREIRGRDLDDVEFRLSDYRGKVVLLDFWAYW